MFQCVCCCVLWFSKSSDATVQRFDKSLEEFYALCDQLELCLVRLKYTVKYMLKYTQVIKSIQGQGQTLGYWQSVTYTADIKKVPFYHFSLIH